MPRKQSAGDPTNGRIEIKCATVIVRMPRRNYEESAKLLKQVGGLFMNVNTKTAHYAKKRLADILKKKVECHQGWTPDGTAGYIFTLPKK